MFRYNYAYFWQAKFDIADRLFAEEDQLYGQ
jgi:hypothetical protein